MSKNIEGNCPYCNNPIQFEVESGKIQKKVQSKGDTFAEGLKKIADDKSKRKEQFENMQKNLAKKRKESNDIFKKGLDGIKKEGLGEKPIRDIDL